MDEYGSANSDVQPLLSNFASNNAPKKEERNQSSLVTIFSLWNTMMGSSLLALPWGFSQAGIGAGMAVLIVIGLICFYTCYLFIKNASKFNGDFIELCKLHTGRFGEALSALISIMVLVGALISYGILMTDSLHTVVNTFRSIGAGSEVPDDDFWNEKMAAGVVAVLVFPFANFKTVGVLLKLATFGLFCVLYNIGFFVYCSLFVEKVHFDSVPIIEQKFYYLAGLLLLSFFIHNCVLSLVKQNKNQKNNARDLGIAYLLTGFCYSLVGGVVYLAYHNDTIPQDFLNFYSHKDIGATIGRIAILMQLITVYPVLAFVIRSQFFSWLKFEEPNYPGFFPVLLLNFVLVATSTLFAMFYPNIGTVLRFVGSAAGLWFVFVLPIYIHLKTQYKKQRGTLGLFSLIVHAFLICFGTAVLVSQFF
jgi:sodium-coupled neutral amino acid transporter 9